MTPHDERIEREVLGAILIDGVTALESCLTLRPEMFFLGRHQTIFRALAKCLETVPHITESLFADALRLAGALEAAGGLAYLMEMQDGVPRRFNPSAHVKKIVELWRLRKGMEICERTSLSFQDGEDSQETFARLQAEAMDVMQDGATFDDPNILTNTIPELQRWQSAKTADGIPYGLQKLDGLTGGMHPGEITILGARNGVGKTSLMVQLAASCCVRGDACDIFSMEMKRGSIMRRLWSIESGVKYRFLRHPHEAGQYERDMVEAAAYKCAEWPLRIFDKSGMDVTQIAAFARMGARNHGVKVVCVDYAQIVSADGRDERAKVTKVSRTLTALAKDEGVHVVLLSQLRKVPIEQYGKAPTLADLRETGQLGDDAHVVILLHRPYSEDTQGLAMEGELVLPKNREGETGAIPVTYNRNNLTFMSR